MMPDTNVREDQPLDAFQPLRDGPDAIRSIIERVLRLEQELLYQKKPKLNEDVLRVIKEEIL
jgi:hypothetical protein